MKRIILLSVFACMHMLIYGQIGGGYPPSMYCSDPNIPYYSQANSSLPFRHWDSPRYIITGDIVLETGTELLISSVVWMPSSAKIVVKRGARLILDGGTIRKYDNCKTWGGIVLHGNNFVHHKAAMLDENYVMQPNDPAIVIIKNNSALIDANIGISLDPSGTPGNPRNYWNGLVVAENSSFINCRRGIKFMSNHKPNGGRKPCLSRVTNCDFIGLDDTAQHGITNWNALGIRVTGCSFEDLENTGITLQDARMVVKGSYFYNTLLGIKCESTAPMMSNLHVGGYVDSASNTFDSLIYWCVQAIGSNKIRIINNEFTTLNHPISVHGNSNYEIKENRFDGIGLGILNTKTMQSPKEISCNIFEDNDLPIQFEGDNRGVKFYNNHFINSSYTDINLLGNDSSWGLGQLSNQGSPGHPFWNYFSINRNITTPTINIATFKYYYPQSSDPRLRPYCASNDTPLDCYHAVGTVTGNHFTTHSTNFSQPPSWCHNSTPQFLRYCVSEACLKKVKDKIQEVAESLGKRPRNSALQDELADLEWQRDYIIQRLIEGWMDKGAYNKIRGVLAAESSTMYLRESYGFELFLGDYTRAGRLLERLPNRKEGDRQFRKVQQINLKRLKYGANSITAAELEQLAAIAKGNTDAVPSAQALHSLLTGADYTYIPELPRKSPERRKVVEVPVSQIVIAPNPAKDVIRVQFPEVEDATERRNLVIFDLRGQVVREMEIDGGISEVHIDMSSEMSGMYFATLMAGKQAMQTAKFVLQKR